MLYIYSLLFSYCFVFVLHHQGMWEPQFQSSKYPLHTTEFHSYGDFDFDFFYFTNPGKRNSKQHEDKQNQILQLQKYFCQRTEQKTKTYSWAPYAA